MKSMSITNLKPRAKRPLFDLRTPLGEIPEEWLKHVEPHVLRGGYLPCWLWIGRVDKAGYPKMNWYDPLRRKDTYAFVHRFVADLFWDFPSHWYVMKTCR